MKNNDIKLSRRFFMKGTGAAALIGTTIGTATLTGCAEQSDTSAQETQNTAAPATEMNMERVNFDAGYNRVNTNSIKFDLIKMQNPGKQLDVGMGIADMDFRTLPEVTAALKERLETENWGYELPPLDYPANIVDWDDFEAQIASGIKLFILCNPQNPTGNCWTADELRRMGDICNEHGCLVLADEIHCDFVMGDNKYVPYAELGEEYAMNSVSYKSTSKSFNLAAHRTGYLFSHNRDHIDAILKVGHQRLLLNIMGLIASNEALKHGDEYIDRQNAYLTENANFVEQFCAERIPDIKYKAHEGTYLAWLDVSPLIEKLDAASKAAELTAYNEANNVTYVDFFGEEHIKRYNTGDYMKEWFMDNAKIDINPGENYGKGGAGFMRMNLATNRAMLEKALSNIEEAINTI